MLVVLVPPWHIYCIITVNPLRDTDMDKSADQNAHESGTALEPLHAVEKVRRITNTLSKFVTGKKTYAKNNPTLAKFAKEFDDAFRTFFEDHEALVLTVEQCEMKWEGRVVYENEKIDDSLAFMLYKDGIGEVTFHNKVNSEQLERFVDLLKDEIHNFSPEEDIVTKLWRSDFEDITYRVLDEYLVGEFDHGQSSDRSALSVLQADDHPGLPSFADSGRVIVDATDSIESISSYLIDLFAGGSAATTESDNEELFQKMLGSFFTISSEELKLCQEEIHREKQRDPLIWFLDGIFDFALLQDNPSVVRDVTDVIECLIEFIVAEGKLPILDETLNLIKRFVGKRPVPESLQPFLTKLEDRFADTSLLLTLGEKAVKWNKDAEALFAYFRTVGKRSVPTICSLLGDLQGSKLHVAACQTLVAVAPDDMHEIIETMNVDDPKIARDITFLLGAIEGDNIPRVVKQLVHYPERAVRTEIVKYLAGKRTEDAVMLLAVMLEDPDKHVRFRTLAAAERIEHPILTNKVWAMIAGKELGQRSLDEQEHFFKTAGRLKGKEMLPAIKGILDKKKLFGLGKGAKEDKLLAIRALEQIGGPESVGMLEGLVDDKNTLVKTKARRAIQAIEKTALSPEAGSGTGEEREEADDDRANEE